MTTPAKGRADFFSDGDWNAVCFECARKRKASEMVRHWKGYYVCSEHWELRHSQDFVRGVSGAQPLPWTQPPADAFIAFCTPNGTSAVPGQAKPGCAYPGYISPFFDINSEI
jgi:hypothetical protein